MGSIETVGATVASKGENRAPLKTTDKEGRNSTMRKATHVLTHDGTNSRCGYCATSRALRRIQEIKR